MAKTKIKSAERDIITSEIYNSVDFLNYFLEDTRKDPFFIDNGCKIYRLEGYEPSFSISSLKTEINKSYPSDQSLDSMFTNVDIKDFKVKKVDPRHLVLQYDKNDREVRKIAM